MRQVCSLLRLLGLILVELGPRALGLTEFLKCTLMSLLLIIFRVLENLFILILVGSVDLLELLRVTESGVEHALIVADECHLTRESLVPVILRFRVNVLLLLERCSVRLISSGVVIDLRVLPKVVEEGSFLVRWLVYLFESTGAV